MVGAVPGTTRGDVGIALARWEERFQKEYGFWLGRVDTAVARYLNCGLAEAGFATLERGFSAFPRTNLHPEHVDASGSCGKPARAEPVPDSV